jgi:AcrR family transcriptional regulator
MNFTLLWPGPRSSREERGFRDPTVDDVCAGAGVSKGAFSGYFEQQQDLLLALRDQPAAALDRELERIANTSSLGVERDRAVSWWRFPPTHSSIRLALTDGLTLHGGITPGAFRSRNVGPVIHVLLFGGETG